MVTRFDYYWSKIKNNRWLLIPLLLGAGTIGVASFTNAVDDIVTFVETRFPVFGSQPPSDSPWYKLVQIVQTSDIKSMGSKVNGTDSIVGSAWDPQAGRMRAFVFDIKDERFRYIDELADEAHPIWEEKRNQTATANNDGPESIATAISHDYRIIGHTTDWTDLKSVNLETGKESKLAPMKRTRGFSWDSSFNVQSIRVFDGLSTWPEDVNGNAWVVGCAQIDGGGNGHAFLYSINDGRLVDLGSKEILDSLPSDYSKAFAINRKGMIVGDCESRGSDFSIPIVWEPINILDLKYKAMSIGTFGGSGGQARDISDVGLVVGWAQDSNSNRRAFVWDSRSPSSVPKELPSLVGNKDAKIIGKDIALARAVNDSGVAVGYSLKDPNGKSGTVAVVWKNNKAFDLNKCAKLPKGVILIDAQDVNANGVIVVNGRTENGYSTAYAMVPSV